MMGHHQSFLKLTVLRYTSSTIQWTQKKRSSFYLTYSTLMETQVVTVAHLSKGMALCLDKVRQELEVTVPLVVHLNHLLVQELLLNNGDKE